MSNNSNKFTTKDLYKEAKDMLYEHAQKNPDYCPF